MTAAQSGRANRAVHGLPRGFEGLSVSTVGLGMSLADRDCA